MTGFSYKGSTEILDRLFFPLLFAEQHFLQGYEVCEKVVNQNRAQLLLLEQTFSINLKSLITPSFIKGSGVIFFFSSKLIDSNICQDHALQQTHGKILYLYTQPPVKKKTIQKRVLNQHARTRTLCVCFLFFFWLIHKVNVLYQKHLFYFRATYTALAIGKRQFWKLFSFYFGTYTKCICCQAGASFAWRSIPCLALTLLKVLLPVWLAGHDH